MKIDSSCFRPLHTNDPGLCAPAAGREGDLPSVVAQIFARGGCSHFAIALRIGGANLAGDRSVA